MANGVPVRLSEALTLRARTVAAVQDRSLTEQVEHWARLGQVVEAAISAGTMLKLKARSYDEGLDDALAFADTSEGRAMAAELIRSENAVRYEETAGEISAVARDGKRTKLVNGARATAKIAAAPRLRAVASAGVTVKIPRRRSKSAKAR